MRKIHWAAALGTVLLLSAFLFVTLAAKWPFNEKTIRAMLESRSGRTVRIGAFQKTYFPPGFVAGDLSFLRHKHPEQEPVIHVKKLVVKGSWSRILTFQHVVPEIEIDHLHLSVPPRGAGLDGEKHELISSKTSSGSNIIIETVNVHQATLDFLPGAEDVNRGALHPFQLEVHDLRLTGFGAGKDLGFETSLRNTVPQGEVHAKGRFGPWNSNDPSLTPVNATFTFANAQLSDIPGIAGTLEAKGKFWGTLDREETEGEASVNDFRVAQSTHTQTLHTVFHGFVDATQGNVSLQKVDTTFGKTTVHAEGRVFGDGRLPGKTAELKASVAGGRVEDLEKMFSHAKIPALIGTISLESSIRLPPGKAKFLERLEMAGNFNTASGHFTAPGTQDLLNRLKESAHGESKGQQDTDRESVPSRMKAHVVVKGGVAHVSNLLLEAQDTMARMDGTYNLLSKEVNLSGTLKTDGKLSDTQSGFKAFAVKMITPFLKKQHSTLVPFELKGTFGNLSSRLDLDGQRKL